MDVLHKRELAKITAPLSLKVALLMDEKLAAMVKVPANVSFEIDGVGRTITLSDYGFHVDGGTLCVHDVELTGGRNVPALVVLGEAAVVNASHVRISHCETYTNIYETFTKLLRTPSAHLTRANLSKAPSRRSLARSYRRFAACSPLLPSSAVTRPRRVPRPTCASSATLARVCPCMPLRPSRLGLPRSPVG
jgi:hypothetical protein